MYHFLSQYTSQNVNYKSKGIHMPKLWPLSQSHFTAAIQLYVCMRKATEMIQTPPTQPIIMRQYCTILFPNVLGLCSELGSWLTLRTTCSQPCSLIRCTIPVPSCNSLPCWLAHHQPPLITRAHTSFCKQL